MATPCNEKQYSHAKKLIGDFCNIILTQDDTLHQSEAKKFIDSLSKEDIRALNIEDAENDPKIKSFVLDEIVKYIKLYAEDDFKKPFEFDTAGAYDRFHDFCKEYYQTKNENNKLPPVLEFTLSYVHDVSDHYRIFGHFYDYRSEVTTSEIIDGLKMMAVDSAKQAAEEKLGTLTDNLIQQRVDNVVNKEMTKVSHKVSETSVTILGIFSGIVLAVVAGLFYSSSVLENINSANFYRLLCISSLIGLVCLHLIIAMFRFIAVLGEKDIKKLLSDNTILFISIILIIFMLAGFILQFVFPSENSPQTPTDLNTNANINVDVSYGTSENESEQNSTGASDFSTNAPQDTPSQTP